MKINSVFVVYLQFTGAHFSSALDVMNRKVLSKIDYENCVWITIDNSISTDVEMVRNSKSYFISGDNSAREFSGFDKGVELLKRLNPKGGDLVIFANDTYHRSYGDSYLDAITTENIQKTISNQNLYGYVDSFPKSVRGFGSEFSSWVRTSFFMVNYSILDKLLPFALTQSKDSVFGNSPEEFFKKNDLLSENYKTYIRTWLFEEPNEKSEFNEAWHSKKKLSVSNFKEMQDKAWCILCEQNMSARALLKNIPTLKMN